MDWQTGNGGRGGGGMTKFDGDVVVILHALQPFGYQGAPVAAEVPLSSSISESDQLQVETQNDHVHK